MTGSGWSTVGVLVRTCHPAPTLVVTSVAVLLGLGMALSASTLWLVAVTVLVGQLSIGWSNDWLDAAVDAAAGRTDKPAARGQINPLTLRGLAVGALVAAVPLSLGAGLSAGVAHLVLVGSGWVYNLGVKRTALSLLPYVIGFGALPTYVALAGDVPVMWWLPVAGALLGAAAHFANAAPDVAADRKTGVMGLPQRIGSRPSLLVAMALLAAAGLLALTQVDGDAGAWWLVIIAPPTIGLALVGRDAGRAVFVMVMVAALLDVIALVAAV